MIAHLFAYDGRTMSPEHVAALIAERLRLARPPFVDVGNGNVTVYLPGVLDAKASRAVARIVRRYRYTGRGWIDKRSGRWLWTRRRFRRARAALARGETLTTPPRRSLADQANDTRALL